MTRFYHFLRSLFAVKHCNLKLLFAVKHCNSTIQITINFDLKLNSPDDAFLPFSAFLICSQTLQLKILICSKTLQLNHTLWKTLWNTLWNTLWPTLWTTLWNTRVRGNTREILWHTSGDTLWRHCCLGYQITWSLTCFHSNPPTSGYFFNLWPFPF